MDTCFIHHRLHTVNKSRIPLLPKNNPYLITSYFTVNHYYDDIFSFQTIVVCDAEHAASIQKGQHNIQPNANGCLVAPGIAPGRFF